MKKILLVVTQLLVAGIVDCDPCTRSQSLNVTSGEVYQNGSLVHDGVLYKSGSWYEVEEDGVKLLLGCPCIDRICIWKCCDAGAAYYNSTCTKSSLSAVNPFSPDVYKGREVSSMVAYQNFFYMHGRTCNASYAVDSGSSTEDLYLQENGTLCEVGPGGSQWHAPGRYCLDMMVNNLSVAPRLVAIVCFPDTTVITDDSPLLYTAYAIGLILSVPFLLATFLVYALIPDLRNLHGMCLMAYCAGLIVAYPFLAYLKLHVGRIGVAMTGCLVVAFIVYYAFQSSFFWLNVMCFDIWRTFSSYRGGSTNKKREKKRFALYAAYAWGVPLVLTAWTAAMQFSDLPSYIITPGFGTKRCWFVDWLSDLVYFFTPVLVLVVCNVVLFTVTANRIRTIRQETAILKGSESSRSDKLKKDKQRYGLYLKLFMVMGVNWTVELISFAVGGSNWYWIVTDISNIGLGVFVFFIFVWKKRVRKLVHKKERQQPENPRTGQEDFNLIDCPKISTRRNKWKRVQEALPSSGTRRASNNNNQFRSMFGMPQTQRDSQPNTSSAPTEDTRVFTDDSAIRLKDMH